MVAAPQTIKASITDNLGDVKAAMMKRGEKDENYLTATLANIMKETGGANKSEDLSGYAKTDNSKIKEIFGDRVKNMSDSQLNSVKSNQQTFAETVYGGEYGRKNLGNIEPGDGWKYRGRGYVQLTGKANYAAASQAIFGDDTLVKDPDLVTQNSKVAAEVTAWFMERGKKKLANKLGISENKTTRDEAALLATSVIANRDARDAGTHIQKKLESVMGSMNSKEIRNIKPTENNKASATSGTTDSRNTSDARSVGNTNTNTNNDRSTGSISSKSSTDALSLLDFDSKGTGQRGNFLALNNDIKDKVLAAAKEYNDLTGSKLKINSGRRSFQEQDILRKDWESGKSQIYAAPAGTSNHETGRAIDIQQGANRDAVAITALNRQGLSQTVPDDPVHFQAKDGGVFKGASTGYNITAHETEAVIPLDENGVSKQPLNTAMFPRDDEPMKIMIAFMQKTNDKYDQMIDLLSASVDNSDKLVAATS
jgi:predicted chitinase/LAS superfamily LD-carboxypeptidase LdcB